MNSKLLIFLLLFTSVKLGESNCNSRTESQYNTQFNNGFPSYYLLEYKVLNCSSLSIKSHESFKPIPKPLPQQIRDMSIKNSSIPIIDSFIFQEYNLENLYLNENDITQIQQDSFYKMSDLKKIELIDNKISVIEEGAFNGNNQLSEINLSSNNLTSLGNLTKLTSLKRLNVSNNKLMTINTNDFHYLENLEMLDLSNNSLNSFPQKIIQNIHNLKKLSLRNNNLESFSSALGNSIEFLDLFNNELNKIDCDQIQGTIIVRQNFLTNLCHFGDNTFVIDFSINQLTEIKSDGFTNLKNLTYLNLSENAISTIEIGAFKNLFMLKTLSLDNNAISSLQIGTFSDLNNLELLDLSSNLIKNIPVGLFTGLGNLKGLNLSDNSIEYIDLNVFFSTSNLENLYLYGNPLIEFDENQINSILPKLLYLSIRVVQIGCGTLQYKLKELKENDITIKQGVEVKEPNVHGIPCEEEDLPDESEEIMRDFLQLKGYIQTIQNVFYLTIIMFVILFASHILSWYQKRSKSNEYYLKNTESSCSLTLGNENNQN